ncbi:hypothetical protein H9639_07935 [Arthrobacter sp. Sa2CUA1]|uniref:DUF3093 domain-containing protein n=1 Tax=Arthrobacter gallicola TaxID=2762225 RepID=A0ABR8US66_9MICC|nr:hypothetical protein [Arthrobacter gallicola]MBD7995222.1 hypothetical protein [Arthrobacter gallicola]
MTTEIRRPSPRGKWEKALDSSPFWLLPIALIAGNSLREMLGFWLSLLVSLGIVVGGTFLCRKPAEAARSRRLEQDAQAGVIECAIRYPGALPGSLRGIWSAGFAEINGRTIKFQSVFDIANQRKGSTVVFGDLRPLGERPLSDKKTLAVRGADRVIGVWTDKGEIELAAPGESLKAVDRHLRHGDGTGS